MKKILLISVITVMLLFVFCFTASASSYSYFMEGFTMVDGGYSYYWRSDNQPSTLEDDFDVLFVENDMYELIGVNIINIENFDKYIRDKNVSNGYELFSALESSYENGELYDDGNVALWGYVFAHPEFFWEVYTSWLSEKNALSYEDGVNAGTELGYTSGYSQGEAAGLKAGYEEGYADYKLSTEYLLELEEKYNEGYYDREAESFVSIDYSFITMAVPLVCVLGAVVIILAVVKRSKKR